MSSSSSTMVHSETYKGWLIQIFHVIRTNSVLAEEEFTAWVGNELTWDECDTCAQALQRARKSVDAYVKLNERY